MLKFLCLVVVCLVFQQANAATVNLPWNTGISGRTTLVFPNDTVVFTVTDGTTHSVSSDTTFFDSGFFTTTFSLNTSNLTLGSYPYHCNVHPSMTGTLVITTNVSNSDTLSNTPPSLSPTTSNTNSISITKSNSEASTISSTLTTSSSQSGTAVVLVSQSGSISTGQSQSGTAVVLLSQSVSKTTSGTLSGSGTFAQSNTQSSTELLSSSVSLSVGASAGAVSASKSLSQTASGTSSESTFVSNIGNTTQTQTLTRSGGVQSQGATPTISTSKAGAKSKTITGLAAINCRQECQVTFVSCKRTSRRLRVCKRAKKSCVSGCGTVNPV